jgi:hypothetical protein
LLSVASSEEAAFLPALDDAQPASKSAKTRASCRDTETLLSHRVSRDRPVMMVLSVPQSREHECDSVRRRDHDVLSRKSFSIRIFRRLR